MLCAARGNVINGLTRYDLLRSLPFGGVIAEIGVAKGAFAREILRTCRPAVLHLIDTWAPVLDAPNAHLDPHNVPDEDAERRYRDVVQRFASEPSVLIHRGPSRHILPMLRAGSLDWAYIDADHRYEAVRDDLTLCLRAVKSDGLIAGHDYTDSAYAQALGFGVTRAVSEFLHTHGWQLVALTDEEFPTYVLAGPKSEWHLC